MSGENGEVKPQTDGGRDINAMSAAELLAELAALRPRRDELASERDDIERQRYCAMNTAKAEGRYADPAWFARAGSALAFKDQRVRKLNRRIQAIEARLGRLGRADNQEKARRREELFIDAARRLLPKSVYLRLWQAVDCQEEDS